MAYSGTMGTFGDLFGKLKFQKRCLLCKQQFTTLKQSHKFCSDCKMKKDVKEEEEENGDL